MAKKQKESLLKGKLFGDALWVLLLTWGQVLDLVDNSHLPLRLHVYTRLGTREGNNTLPKDVWLSSPSPGPNGAAAAGKQIGSALPKELRAVWLFPVFPLVLSSVQLESSLSTGSLSFTWA